MACHDLTSILDEGFEEVILGGGQLDLLPVDLYKTLGKINFEWPNRKNWLCPSLYLGGMSKRHSYSCQYFINAKWLGNIVISTQIKSLNFITLGILDREHNDGQIRLLTYPLSYL